MNIVLLQSHVFWEDPKRNIEHFGHLIANLSEKTDLVFLPELFSTGFTMNVREYAEKQNGDTFCWMKNQASCHNVVLAGSYIAEEKGMYFNRLVWMEPNGRSAIYDKRHLFRIGDENEHYSPGNRIAVVTWKSWHIRPLICYDLRFPVWSRNRNDYDVLAYIANWPSSRQDVWDALLKARAIENQAYVIGLNRVGKDGRSIEYAGGSVVYGPDGNALVSSKTSGQEILQVELSLNELRRFRKKFPVHLDADDFNIKFST